MAKKRKASRWTNAHQEARNEAILQKKIKKTGATPLRYRQGEALAHGTALKREQHRLQLHITKTKAELQSTKRALEQWDPVEVAAEAEAKKKAAEAAAAEQPPKKRRFFRKSDDPETWKLKGAARPAWEVYDFDTRYVDPVAAERQKHQAKQRRTLNLLAIHRGRLGRDGPELGRDYLGLLMQYGHLNLEAKQFKSARAAWLECIELEGEEPVTTARERLMRMYVNLQRYEAAWRLGERFPKDTTVYVRYSTALVSLLSGKADAEKHLVSAIRSNRFCAYYLAFYEIFCDVMEYTDELEEAYDQPQSSLEEAIEYCASPHGAKWDGEPRTTLQKLVICSLRGDHEQLSADNLQWEDLLASIEKEYLLRVAADKDMDDLAKGKHANGEEQSSDAGSGDEGSAAKVKDEPVIKGEEQELNGEKEQEETTEGQDESASGGDEGASGDANEDEAGNEQVAADTRPAGHVDVAMYAGMFRTAMEMVKAEGHI